MSARYFIGAGAGAGRPSFQLARSVMMSEVASARFAGCERSNSNYSIKSASSSAVLATL